MTLKLISIVQHPDAMGVTQASLKHLRNGLAARASHRIAVVEIPTADEGCGFMILDLYSSDAVFTGEGFSDHCGGEGMAGYNTAKGLFGIYGITPSRWDKVDFDGYIDLLIDLKDREAGDWLLGLAQRIANSLPESGYKVPADNNPEYIRTGYMELSAIRQINKCGSCGDVIPTGETFCWKCDTKYTGKNRWGF